MINFNKYSGCFMGLAMGDAYGARFEGGPIERLLWRMIGKTRQGKLRYTDDTQMSIDVAMSFIHNKQINQQHLANTFADHYRWSRGYGPGAAWLLKKIKKGAHWQDVNQARFKGGSFGNGAAMRAPILALCFSKDQQTLNNNVVKCSEITHAHPLAIEGAKLIALVTYAALHDWTTINILENLAIWCTSSKYKTKVAFCSEFIQASELVQVKVLKHKLGNSIAAPQSCVTAIYFALQFRGQTYDLMLTQICKLGGDTDTIAAMAGAIWGAFNGFDALEINKIQSIENSQLIIELAETLYKMT